jgi:hypothetical protein
MTPHDVMSEVSPIFNRVGAAWYFAPETMEAGQAVGLDGLRFYFVGRGGTLGDVDHRVVSAAFGYFEPGMVAKYWTTGRERCPVAQAVAAHLGACEAFGRSTLAGVGDLDRFCEVAGRLVDVAATDLGGLPLFAGHVAQPLPDDAPARAIRLIATLREWRGSVHLACVAAAGLPTGVAHAVRRPDMVGFFGWGDGAGPEATDADLAALTEADRMTDAAVLRSYGALDTDELDALVSGARAVGAAVPGATAGQDG